MSAWGGRRIGAGRPPTARRDRVLRLVELVRALELLGIMPPEIAAVAGIEVFPVDVGNIARLRFELLTQVAQRAAAEPDLAGEVPAAASRDYGVTIAAITSEFGRSPDERVPVAGSTPPLLAFGEIGDDS